jgi:hypothetical protein
MRRDPNVKLMESRFQAFLESLEKLAMTRFIGYIHEEAGKIIVVGNACLLSPASQSLGLPRRRAKLASRLRKRLD